MPYSSYRDRIGKLKYGVPNVCEIKTNLEKHVENIDNSFNSTLTLNNLIVGGGLKIGYISSTNMDGVIRYDNTDRLQIYYNSRWNLTSGGIWSVDTSNNIRITNDNDFIKPLIANTLDVSENITIRNPQTSAPKFSINDLFGPLRDPIVVNITNTSTSFTIEVTPITQYAVGFQSSLIPEISSIEVKLENDDVTANTINNTTLTILDSAFNSTDIGNNWNNLKYLEFSKVDGTTSGQHNGFSTDTYTFNYIATGAESNTLNTILWDISDNTSEPHAYSRYKLSINYKNNHPTENIKIVYDISLSEPPKPNVINASVIQIENTSDISYNNDVYSDVYGINSFRLRWSKPSDNDDSADILDYDISYSVSGPSLNGEDFTGQYNEINSIATTLYSLQYKTISNILYGTKYDIQIRAQNTSGAQQDYSGVAFSMPFYTHLPPKPSNTSFSILTSWDNNIDYDHANVSSGYYKYNSSGSGSYADENTSSRPKLINKNSLSTTPNTMVSDIIGLKIHTYATILPSTTTTWDISGVLQINGVKHTSSTSYTTAHSSDISRNIYGVTNYTSEGTVDVDKRIDFSSQIYDYYTTTSDITENKNKFWMAMDISNIELKLDDASRLDTGSISLYFTDNSGIVYNSSSNFIVDDLNIAPIIANKSSSLKTTTDVEWNCGISNFKADNIFLFTLNITKLASGTDGYFPLIGSGSDKRKQFNISSSYTNNKTITHNGSFGIGHSTNTGDTITYTNTDIDITFNSNETLIDDTNIGSTFNFTIEAYNIFDTTPTTITSPLILRDHASLNNSLRSSRYIDTSGDPTSQAVFSSVDNQALNVNELLLWKGYYSGSMNDYKDFTVNTYNQNVTTSLSNLYGTYNVNTFRYGLFRFSGLAANTSEITIVFTSPSSENNFDATDSTGTSPQSNFSLELYLATSSNPSGIWCDGNQPTEFTANPPRIYKNRTKSGNTTTIKVSPPGYSSHLSNLWMRVGLQSKLSNALKFTNISVSSTQ